MKFYIATHLENTMEHNLCRDLLRQLGHEITYDWTVNPYEPVEESKLSETAELEVNGVKEADYVVVILPGGIGTHVELGAALTLGKDVLLVAEEEELVDHRGWPFPFYHHPGVEIVGDQVFNVVGHVAFWTATLHKVPQVAKAMNLPHGEVE